MSVCLSVVNQLIHTALFVKNISSSFTLAQYSKTVPSNPILWRVCRQQERGLCLAFQLLHISFESRLSIWGLKMHLRTVKTLTNMCIRTVSSESSLSVYVILHNIFTFRPKYRNEIQLAGRRLILNCSLYGDIIKNQSTECSKMRGMLALEC